MADALRAGVPAQLLAMVEEVPVVEAPIDPALEQELWRYLEDAPGSTIAVDLTDRTVTAGANSYPFTIDDYTAHRLLNGLDDIGITLTHADDITEFEGHRPAWMPATA